MGGQDAAPQFSTKWTLGSRQGTKSTNNFILGDPYKYIEYACIYTYSYIHIYRYIYIYIHIYVYIYIDI
jgi:hypothetical protein